MKLSFSTRGWRGYSWQQFCDTAVEMEFQGIELHNIYDEIFTGPNGIFDKKMSSAAKRKMFEIGVEIPCIDSVCNIADENTQNSINEISKCIDAANSFGIPYVRLHATGENVDDEKVYECLKSVVCVAEKANVTLLIETVGIYSNTESLREMLNRFACDNLGALWDMHYPYRNNGETPDVTVKNLGAYIKHVHLKDSEVIDGNIEYRLIGEGTLPLEDMIKALRSISYEGFISLEWDSEWMPELNDMGMIFLHFVSYMSKFSESSKKKNTIYENKRHDGKFIWQKEALISTTFSEVLDKQVEEFPDQCAIKYTTLDYERTYSEFRNDVDTFARALISMGVKKGSHVSIWATNVPQWFITFWAATKIGAVLVTVNTAYKVHEAEYLLKQSDTHTLVMIDGYRDSNYKEIINELCPELAETAEGSQLHSKRLPFLRNVITVGFKNKGCITWDEAINKSSSVPVEEVNRMAAAVDCHDVCNMQYTSGTTGFPKGVMLTHYNVVNNGKCIGDRMDLSTADRLMIQVPMFHCFGMVLAMTATMTHGGTILPVPYFSPKSSLACVHNERVTAFHGVPTMFIAMLEHKDFEKTDFSHVRTGIMAGSPCPIAVMEDVVKKMNMSEIVIVFGQTESSPGCTMSSTDDPLDIRVSTVGSPMPEIECKIVDPETGAEMADGENGEFIARGYNIMKGYYKMPKATDAAIDKDGWLHTGDLACKTPEGNFKITGRLKDMIIRGGENIYPKEIEEFLYTNSKVKDVQVIGVPDEQYGEEIMACIVLKKGEESSVEEMKEYITSHMARHKVPKYIDFVDGFPMNAAGKILKYKMRQDAIAKLGLQSAEKIVTA